MTLDEALKVLRQHNEKGASVLRITRGQALEKDLLKQVLDSCEQLISEKAEYKRLLKAAVAVLNDGSSIKKCEDCTASCTRNCKFKWCYTDEALALIGEDGDTNG